jgi:hypothetical protein
MELPFDKGLAPDAVKHFSFRPAAGTLTSLLAAGDVVARMDDLEVR